MAETFSEMLTVGGKSNSLGRVNEVIEIVLRDKSRLDELYDCLFLDDSWARMRAADALEKVCRLQPKWLLPYVDRFFDDLAASTQPSIQWHFAQVLEQVELNESQKYHAIDWLKKLVSTTEVDWIVAANAMDTLYAFTKDGSVSPTEMIKMLEVQRHHKSNAVVKRANKLLVSLTS